MAKARKCLIYGCGKPGRARGLCVKCYQAARRMVALGETTWAELEKYGQAAPEKPRGGIRVPFMKQFRGVACAKKRARAKR